MMQLEDEDDPVVQEVDVYLCKQLLEKLYLLQYPVRPAHLPYDSVEHLNAKMKPKQQKLEMELAINTDSPNYAKSKGEQIAVNVDGAATGSEDQETFFATGMMDKQTLTSQAVNIDVDRYAVGFYKDGEFHLNPLTGIIQLRGSFSYLDKVDQRQKAEQEIESSQEEEEEAKPVMVKFARHETEEAKARRMASYEHLKKVQAEEAWINMRHHTKDQPMAEAERRLLTAQQSQEVSEFYISQDEYLGKLIPKWEEKATEKPALPSNVLSMTELKTMSLGDQVKALLINAKVIRFSQLLSLLPKGVDATAVLRCVQQVALLVQGCWVIKSDLLYPANSHSAVSGATAEALCRGRDYIMWRFTQHRHLTRKDIASVIKLHAEDVKDILEQMAFLRVNKGWEFLMATDSEFLHRHHEAAQRQHMIWDAKFHQIAKVLKVSPADMKQAAAASASPPRPRRRTTSRSRTKSGGGGFSDASDSESCGRERRLSGADRARHGSGASKRRHSSGTGNFENHSTALAMETDVDPHNSGTVTTVIEATGESA